MVVGHKKGGQGMLASTFWAHSGALRHGIEDADVNVRRKICDKIL